MERYLDITMEYSQSGKGFLKQLRQVLEWSKRNYQLEGYRLARMAMKRYGRHVRCHIIFAPNDK